MRILRLLIFTCITTCVFSQNLTNGLQACYPMDCSAQNFAPTGASLNGTAANLNCVTGHTGLSNTAYSFAGLSNSYFVVPGTSLTKPTASLTVSGWYNLDPNPVAVPDQYVVYTKNNCGSNWEAIALYARYSGGNFSFNLEKHASPNCYGLDVYQAGTVSANTWNHVVFYVSNDSIKLYVNGAIVGSAAHSVPFDYMTGKDFVLGGSNESPYFFPFKGKIDDVRFYNRELTLQEVGILYSQSPSCEISALPPVATFTMSKTSICRGQSIVFTDQSTNNPTSWNWQIPGGTPSTASIANPIITFMVPGTYIASLTSSNSFGASNTATQTITVSGCVSLEEEQGEKELKFYPNPTNGKLFCDDLKNRSVRVYDISGKEVVFTQKYISDTTIEFNLEETTPGFYFVKVFNAREELVQTLKLVLVK
jgi:PKD repeat protein